MRLKPGGDDLYDKRKKEEIIKKSHERSKIYGIEKERIFSKRILMGNEVSGTLEKNKELINVADAFMKILYDFLEASGFIIFLTDREGCILNIVGDEKIIEAARELNMIVGAFMDEGNVGTNAMGIAIKEDSPIQISAKEHFINAYHRWTCSAAPIHNVKGEIIGTLNLTGGSDLVHPHTLGLVVAAVKSIENQLKVENAQKKLKEAYQYMKVIMNSISSGIIALDREGIINSINDEACRMLNLNREEIINNSVEDILYNWKHFFKSLEEGKKIEDEEINLKINGIRKSYNMNIYPIFSEKNQIKGIVILLKDIQNVFNLVNKYTGMNARYTFEDFIGNSAEIKKIKEYAKGIADSPSTVLIEGESGTGKEVLAQAIHNYSNRRNGGFVAINCGAISKNLIESELFGYDDGAFTGARKGGKPGKFELANGGTLFLDEIGEMPLDMQVNLLRVLQEGVVTRIGGSKYIPVDVRIIAATNKDLRKEVARGTFRQDLYYRLSVIPIVIPPLRERREDIFSLVEHFLKIKCEKLNKSIPNIHKRDYQKLLSYNWQGNVRELENFIEKIVNFNGDVDYDFIGSEEISYDNLSLEEIALGEEDYICSLEDLEKRAIIACLSKFNGNITKVSSVLGIGRNTLYSKMKKYNIGG
ncbi:sigma 54-interacting transcriptional regulator [Clostridium sp. MSJ-4]|uniref:Sigma 54-interacting transcriptional regulator n=1 Tax=Clostridium simiarum TaxID=2841506 RepID=A0ABS6F0M3_9CLOT|nr:sigma 54-interacting transcriptional regulator [Clostridium simiarum]